MGLDSEAEMYREFLSMAKLLNIYLNHFPKHEKYALCQDIRGCAYSILGMIVECQKRYYKKTTLTNLDIEHEMLRAYIKLAFDLGYFNFKDGSKETGENKEYHRYSAISRHIDTLGRMIGGWIRNERAVIKQKEDCASECREIS